mmetsp:Transcript_36540/g.72786  ORF Transcript_36540/g.72786 Transcript_36540/m.72786 type:complete len:268 (-) Transcript_36540:1868-2671(-)
MNRHAQAYACVCARIARPRDSWLDGCAPRRLSKADHASSEVSLSQQRQDGLELHNVPRFHPHRACQHINIDRAHVAEVVNAIPPLGQEGCGVLAQPRSLEKLSNCATVVIIAALANRSAVGGGGGRGVEIRAAHVRRRAVDRLVPSPQRCGGALKRPSVHENGVRRVGLAKGKLTAICAKGDAGGVRGANGDMQQLVVRRVVKVACAERGRVFLDTLEQAGGEHGATIIIIIIINPPSEAGQRSVQHICCEHVPCRHLLARIEAKRE